MSDIENSGKNCAEFRALADRLADGEAGLTVAQKEYCQEHVKVCKACRAWQYQTREIVDMVSMMPQFDVSEALTQRILSSVERERGVKSALEALPAMPLGIVAGFSFILLLPMDGIQGAFSWTAAIAGLVLFQVLLKSTASSEAAG